MNFYVKYTTLATSNRLYNLILALFITSPVFAYPSLDRLPNGHKASLIIESETQKEVDLNSTQLFPPASTLKLFTALAAKLALPNDFRFTTYLEASHDVVFRFSGDPSLTYSDIESLVIALKSSGIRQIEGDIWLDNSAFTGYERGVGWPWDILGVCYSAPASAITIDHNCVQASISTLATGETRVFVPSHQPISAKTEAKSVTKEMKSQLHCDLELLARPDNHYTLAGCLTERSRPLPLKFAVQDTQSYAKAVINGLLEKHDIAFENDFKIGKAPAAKPIAQHDSAPLDELLKLMLKESDNLIADNLTKKIGVYYYQQPGSFASGTAAIKAILLDQANIDLANAQLEDGSGLSRNNKVTAQSMNQVLNYIWKNDDHLGLINMIPVAGKDGTLRYRSSMRRDPIAGQIRGKSGSIFGSHNMAGFGLDSKGKPASTFVQFISDYHYSVDENAAPSTPPITQFEQAFYNDVLRFSVHQ